MSDIQVRPEETTAIAPASRSTEVMSMLQYAIDKGVDPGAMRELADLHEKIERREAEKQFNQALVDFQTTCPPIPRVDTVDYVSSSGKRVHFMYADFETIMSVVRPHASRFGFAFVFTTVAPGPGLLVRTCMLLHRNGHSIRSDAPVTTANTNPGMSDQQKYSAAETIASRRALLAVLGLAHTDADAESQAHAEPVTAEQAATLDALINEVKADRVRFLAHFKVSALADVPQGQFGEAVRMLEAKRKGTTK